MKIIRKRLIGLPIIFIIVSSVSILSFVSINKIKKILIEQEYNKLKITRDIKKEQIRNYIIERVSDIDIISKSTDITDLVRILDQYSKIERDDPSYVINDIALPNNEFIEIYMKNGYSDMFIISLDGQIQYSHKNSVKPWVNINDKKFKKSGFKKVWQKVIEKKRIVFAETKIDKNSYRSSLYIGSPIYIDNKLKAVLIFHISNMNISKIMDFGEGYAKTQQDHLIGRNNIIKDNSLNCYSIHTNQKYKLDEIINQCDNEATRDAFNGHTGEKTFLKYNKKVLSAYAPLKLNKDLDWVILSEIDEDKVLLIPNRIKNTIIIDSIIFILIIIGMIIFLIYRILKDRRVEISKEKEVNENLKAINNELKQSGYEVKLENEKLEIRVDEEIEKNEHQKELLFQQSKMASMGEMIGNIAHQWRQPLNALSGLVVWINMKYNINQLNEEDMIIFKEKSNKLIQKMSNTIDDFRNFFSPNKTIEVFSVNSAIYEAIKFIEDSFLINNIVIVADFQTTKEIKNYKNELIQVLLNIFNNSKDAIKEKNITKGLVKIILEEVDKSIIIKIQDNGGGIKQDIIDRVFEPYFTTKFKSDGTGIGLYMSKMIIE
ncbi:MAG: sensor histidine kinase, partial [Sulfurovaceae bacterium]|nr:sensor histidine kinase [Sulfurovaceae bacterium]